MKRYFWALLIFITILLLLPVLGASAAVNRLAFYALHSRAAPDSISVLPSGSCHIQWWSGFLAQTSDDTTARDEFWAAAVVCDPDLVVFLQSSTDRLMNNIKKRNRKIERALNRNYIEKLSEAYNHFFFRYNSTPLLIVNSTETPAFPTNDS